MEYTRYETRGHIGILTVSRPKALNALNSAVVAELAALLQTVAASDIRCLIVTGDGEKAFVAGADIREMQDMSPDEATAFSREGNAVMRALETLPQPVIAAVNGYALGGGLELALACDIRVASENAAFGLPETGLGIPPGYGGIQRLVRALGLARAKELVFTARRIKAPEALALGLVSAVCPQGELVDHCLTMAEKIAANAPAAVRAAKQIANGSAGLTLEESCCLESVLFGGCFATNDQKMAMRAFVDKTDPRPFSGT